MQAWRVVLLGLAGCGFGVGAGAGLDQDGGADGARADAAVDAMCVGGPDTDGDGVVDACDPCPLDPGDDSDGDGSCDGVDLCPQFDDNVDGDGDAVPDGCDDWPCGAKPTGPTAIVAWTTANENVTLSTISVAGQGQLAVATPGQSLSVAVGYSIVDCQCTNCIDQIELGFEPGGKQACFYNGNPQGGAGSPGCLTPTVGSVTRTVTAPGASGVHQLRFNRGNDTSCQNNGQWWAGVAPPSGNTFALVCVR